MLVSRVLMQSLRPSTIVCNGGMILRRFSSIIDRVTGKIAREKEKDDIVLIERFAFLASCLQNLPLQSHSNLSIIARDIRAKIDVADSAFSFDNVHSSLQGTLIESIARHNAVIENFSPAKDYLDEDIHLWLRCQLLKSYFDKLKKLQVDGEIKAESLSPGRLSAISDSFLLGTSSERIAGHLSLFGEKLNQYQLQDSFYSLFEQEISCCEKAFTSIKGLQKHHKKKFKSFCKDYLLDTLELNVKSRSVFAWSDPNHSGFKPIPDDHIMPLSDLLKSRNLYFKKAVTIGRGFLTEYCTEIKKMYEDRREFRSTARNGAIFFVATCLLDWLICVI